MEEQKIKCVVWDLDCTIWDGVLIENDDLKLRDNVVSVIKALDERGILQSISSKNNEEDAREKLEELGLWEYFIYSQINWNPKSLGVEKIAESINIGIDTLAFVDDQQFERDEVHFTHPEVMCIDANDVDKILSMERMMPKFVTEDSKNRRKLYQNDIVRNDLEKDFEGTKEEFLKSLDMRITIEPGKEGDLQRMEELTVRTHQLNSTGYTYSYDELKSMINSDDYIVLVASLDDKYGTYGKIGLSVIEKKDNLWRLNLLLMSCRVMSKGVGNIMMNSIINYAIDNHKDLDAIFVPSKKNRIMYITYKFNGFKEKETTDEYVILQADTSTKRIIPDYISLVFKA